MRKELLATSLAFGIGISMSGCGGSTEVPEPVTTASAMPSKAVPAEITDTHLAVLRQYECNVEPANIEIVDLSQVSEEQFGNSETGLALTSAEGIKLSSNQTTEKMGQMTIHETIHWCADRGNVLDYPNPLDIPGIGALTATDGFVPFINGDHTQGNTFAEEGVVEWVANQNPAYKAHESYVVLAGLTDQISKIRGFNEEAAVDLLKQDDLIGLTGLMKAKDSAEVTGKDVADIVFLYMDSDKAKKVPEIEVTQAILDR